MIADTCQRMTERIDALQLRERILLLGACLTLLYYAVDSFGLQPVFEQQQELRQHIADQEARLAQLHTHVSLPGDNSLTNPEATRTRLQAELDDLNARLQTRLGGMLAPEAAAGVLDQVLARESGLTLHAINARRTPLTAIDTGTGDDVTVPGVGRYELELQLEGDFLATLNYLRALEALPWSFFWENVTFEVTEHPKARVTLDLYTLELITG